MRNLGVAMGHAMLAYQSLDTGLSKVELDERRLDEDLRDAWEVLGEAIQTVMRAHGIPDAYDRLKAFTRGRAVDEVALREFITSLPLPAEDKDRLLGLEPGKYLGIAPLLARRKR
jgi:adenylosuccinate lyase